MKVAGAMKAVEVAIAMKAVEAEGSMEQSVEFGSGHQPDRKALLHGYTETTEHSQRLGLAEAVHGRERERRPAPRTWTWTHADMRPQPVTARQIGAHMWNGQRVTHFQRLPALGR